MIQRNETDCRKILPLCFTMKWHDGDMDMWMMLLRVKVKHGESWMWPALSYTWNGQQSFKFLRSSVHLADEETEAQSCSRNGGDGITNNLLCFLLPISTEKVILSLCSLSPSEFTSNLPTKIVSSALLVSWLHQTVCTWEVSFHPLLLPPSTFLPRFFLKYLLHSSHCFHL